LVAKLHALNVRFLSFCLSYKGRGGGITRLRSQGSASRAYKYTFKYITYYMLLNNTIATK